MNDVDKWIEAMRSGDFAAARKISDRLLLTRGAEDQFQLPRWRQSIWDGSDVAGKRVLVRCYHGLGDTIHFIRYAALLKKIAAEVPYVFVDPAVLARDGRMRVGLIWRSGDWDERRSVPFSQAQRLAQVARVEWHILQREPLAA